MSQNTSFQNRLADWKDKFLKEHVQKIDTDGKFLSSESIVVFSGPPTLDQNSIATLIPVGLVQNIQLQQQKQIQQFFEIGSRKPIYIPGRTQTSASVSRILFDGPSLMKALYAQPLSQDQTGVPTMNADSQFPQEQPADPFPTGGGELASVEDSGAFYINLASNFFNKPVGLGLAMYNMDKQSYSAIYLEGCYLRAHQFSIQASQTVLAESVNIMVTDVIPLDKNMIGS